MQERNLVIVNRYMTDKFDYTDNNHYSLRFDMILYKK